MTNLVASSAIRQKIVAAILADFQQSMPIYAEMMSVAKNINDAAGPEESDRLGRIMHAAIRCASPQELRTVKDILALMGCEPVNYYDLREKVSVQSTAFRPTCPLDIQRNGFRLFCSMLSIDCITESDRHFVESIIGRRDLFSETLQDLLETGKQQGGLDEQQGEAFVAECVNLFIRPETAMVSKTEHEQLRAINKVAAQVLVTNSLAFNHLTPSVASVPEAHRQMLQRGIQTIPVWQGPVGKDVVLRQTSCLAPPVKLKFPADDGAFVEADYQETFVEFEERLNALTAKGRLWFEDLFARGKQQLALSEADPGYADHYYEVMSAALEPFPSDLMECWTQELAYFTFECDEKTIEGDRTFAQLVSDGVIQLVPQKYEDFFGPAATNIFNSNIGLDDVSNVGVATANSQSEFESKLGRPIVNMYDYYDTIEADSRAQVCQRYNIKSTVARLSES